MQLSQHCDYEIEPGRYCNKSATWLALSGDAPEMWADQGAGNASLASFCSYFHAKAEPRPNLAAAKRAAAIVADTLSGGYDYGIPDAWQRAIDAYPRPVPYTA
jgi:hypothetical protein